MQPAARAAPLYPTAVRTAVRMFTALAPRRARGRAAFYHASSLRLETRQMPWRNGPHARAPGACRRTRAAAARHRRTPARADGRDRAGRGAGRAGRQRRAPRAAPERWSREVFELIEWRRFEAVVEALFARPASRRARRPHGADGGVDIWLYSRTTPRATRRRASSSASNGCAGRSASRKCASCAA